MALAFLLDENVPGRLWRAIQRHNEEQPDFINAVRVGEPLDLPLSADDPSILLWAERNGRLLITEDKSTMPVHLAKHLANGHRCPGILMLVAGISVVQLIEYLALIAHASQGVEWQDRIEYITRLS